MAELLFDFANPEQAEKFPQHGWAKNSQGRKLLWLPVTRLFSCAKEVREAKNVNPLAPMDSWLAASFYQMVYKLVTTLCEIQKFLRKSSELSLGQNQTPEEEKFVLSMFRLMPLYIDLAYIYLRRLADGLTVASSPILFEHYKSAPKQFKNLIKEATDQSKVTNWNPLCDLPLLQQTVTQKSSWFERLRGTDPKGIRDAMEHNVIVTNIGISQRNNDSPETFANFMNLSSKDYDFEKDLILPLKDIIAEFCQLLTGIHTSIGWGGGYQVQDLSPNRGTHDDDLTGFWPEIGV